MTTTRTMKTMLTRLRMWLVPLRVLATPVLAAALVATWAAAPPAQADDSLSAAAFVERKSEELLAVVNRESAYFGTEPERFIQAVQEELAPFLDMRVAVRRVMGSYYRQASKEQRRRFGTVFRDSLIESFARAIAEFEFESIEVVDSKQKEGSRQAQVEMVVQTRSSRVSLTYYLYQARSGAWKLFNIRIDGADLTSVYLGQFASRMAAYNNIDRVIDSWGG